MFFGAYLWYHMQGFRCATPWEEGLGPEWEPFWFQRSERSTQIEWCLPSLFSHLQRFQTLLLSLTMPHYLFISLWRMQMSVWFLTMRRCMTFVSVPSSWQLLAVSSLSLIWITLAYTYLVIDFIEIIFSIMIEYIWIFTSKLHVFTHLTKYSLCDNGLYDGAVNLPSPSPFLSVLN